MANADHPPLDADPDTWDDHWQTKTTITVDRGVKAWLDVNRDGRPWNDYLMKLRQSYADPVTQSDAEAIAEYLKEHIELTPNESDLEAIVRRVIREELEAATR